MLLASGVSTIGGVAFLIMSAEPGPNPDAAGGYAATGGVDFILEAWLLRRRFRRAAVPTETCRAETHPNWRKPAHAKRLRMRRHVGRSITVTITRATRPFRVSP
jgi:hypothetical protein